MPGEAIWDEWEKIVQYELGLPVYKWAFIIDLIGVAVGLIFGIWGAIVQYILLNPIAGTIGLVSTIIFAAIGAVGAILYISIMNQLGKNDYENINLVMFLISAILAVVGTYWYGFLHAFVMILFVFLSEYGWFAGGGTAE